jgi:hypothetical protein
VDESGLLFVTSVEAFHRFRIVSSAINAIPLHQLPSYEGLQSVLELQTMMAEGLMQLDTAFKEIEAHQQLVQAAAYGGAFDKLAARGVPGGDGPVCGLGRGHLRHAHHSLGLLTRLAAIPLIVIMSVAIVSTKLPIWAGQDIWIFHMPKLARYGFWSMAHEARDDFLMLLGSLYLLIAGAECGLSMPCSPAKAPPLHRRGN